MNHVGQDGKIMKDVTIGGLTVGNTRPLLVIAGPCQLESLDHAQMIAGTMREACAAAGAQFVFKASYDKANRTSLKGRRGLGIEAGLQVLEAVRATGIPVLTDVHDADQARLAAQVVDVIQIPAFLCRQTDLLLAAADVRRDAQALRAVAHVALAFSPSVAWATPADLRGASANPAPSPALVGVRPFQGCLFGLCGDGIVRPQNR